MIHSSLTKTSKLKKIYSINSESHYNHINASVRYFVMHKCHARNWGGSEEWIIVGNREYKSDAEMGVTARRKSGIK